MSQTLDKTCIFTFSYLKAYVINYSWCIQTHPKPTPEVSQYIVNLPPTTIRVNRRAEVSKSLSFKKLILNGPLKRNRVPYQLGHTHYNNSKSLNEPPIVAIQTNKIVNLD